MTAPDLKTATYEEVVAFIESSLIAGTKSLIGKPFNPGPDLAAFERILRGLAINPNDPIICINGLWIDTRTIRFDPDSYALTVDAVPDPVPDPDGYRFIVTVDATTNKATVTPA